MRIARVVTRELLPLMAVLALLVLLIVNAAMSEEPPSNAAMPKIPKGKETTLGLYVTAKEAYRRWQDRPETVKILDVRTTEEFLFVGHASMAWSIPASLQTYEWDADKGQLPMQPNPDFVSQVQTVFAPEDTILVMCRSGGRSARAVNQLAEAGFKHVYNILDGMEGDKVDDPESVFFGQRMKNGWKNSGVPWTYDVAPERVLLPKTR